MARPNQTDVEWPSVAAPLISRVSVPGALFPQTGPISKSEVRADIALLFCALFLQRFSVNLGNSYLSLDVVPAAFIFVHQFVNGRFFIQYDRLLWFIAAMMAVTYSLVSNFKTTMLSSYALFFVVYSLFTLYKPSTPEQFKSTLHGFQVLAAILSFLAVVQFVAQFVVDGRDIVLFFGIVPDFLLASLDQNRANTIIPIMDGSSFIKSNGIFLTEPSTMSQIAALGILIEVLEFRRTRYLLLFPLGLLLSYSGTGLMIVLFFLPVAGLQRRAALPVLLVFVFTVGLFATGIIDASALLSRAGEFDDTRASGFQRFISPFWLAADHFNTAHLRALLFGSGPGTTDDFVGAHYWFTGSSGSWIKLLYEYGLIGSFVFTCFFASCFRRGLCPRLLVSAILFYYVVLGGLLLSTPFLIMAIVLCTLHGPAPRHSQTDEMSRHSLLARASW